MKRGFTIVELLITMVILALLLTLGVVSLRGVQANARDQERKTDIEVIARGLEQYYRRGTARITGFATKGTYPGANEWEYIFGKNWCSDPTYATAYTPCSVPDGFVAEALPGVNTSAITPPGMTTAGTTSTWNKTDAVITSDLSSGKYVYKPLDTGNSSTCVTDGGCPRYELMYQRELPTPATIIVKSKHQ